MFDSEQTTVDNLRLNRANLMLAVANSLIYLPGANRSGRKGKRYLVRAGLGCGHQHRKGGDKHRGITAAGTEEPADGRHAVAVYPDCWNSLGSGYCGSRYTSSL